MPRDPYNEHIDAIRDWLEFLDVLDAWDDTTSRYWDTDQSPEFYSLSGRYGWWAMILARWIADNSNVSPEPMLEVTRMVQAKDPLGQMTAFHATPEEIDRRRQAWRPYRQILIDQAMREIEGRATADAESVKLPVVRIDEPPPVCHVTLLQMGAIVNRSKKTIRRLFDQGKLPPPSVTGERGRPHEWRWCEVRPILELQFNKQLPETYPADRFVRS